MLRYDDTPLWFIVAFAFAGVVHFAVEAGVMP